MEKEQRINLYINKYKDNQKERLMSNITLLDAYSPLKILERGYAIALKDDIAIRSVNDVHNEDVITIIVNDGKLITKVLERDIKNGK